MTRTLIWRIVGSIGGAEWFICGSTNEEELSETFDLREHHCFADLSLIAAPALAHQCTNASKSDPAAGAQIVFGPDEQPIFITQGLLSRIDRGLDDAETGEGFHGIIAFDLDGDVRPM